MIKNTGIKFLQKEYQRSKAVSYSNRWALSRNPQYFDYSDFGGDCTNFISQCIYAGSGIMNYTPIWGWYYIDGNRKAPAWTGVEYLYNFITRSEESIGPYGKQVQISDVEPGDIIQLAFNEMGSFEHSLFIVECGDVPNINNIFINTHSYDRLRYPLSNYYWKRIRFIKILGVRG